MRTHDTTSLRVTGWLAGLALGLVLLLAGCAEGISTPAGPEDELETGSSQDDSAGSDSSDDVNDSNESDGTDNNADQEDDEPVQYVWGLPPSDTSVGDGHQGAEGSAYEALQRSCSEGAQFLDSDFAPEYGFESPRNVLLFAAGVQLCEGNHDRARGFFDQAEVYGATGLQPDGWAFCDLYRAVQSVLEQRPPEDFQCAGDVAPRFKAGDSATDDPLTPDVDESLAETEADPDGDTEIETDFNGETETDGGAETETDVELGTETDPAPGIETEPER